MAAADEADRGEQLQDEGLGAETLVVEGQRDAVDRLTVTKHEVEAVLQYTQHTTCYMCAQEQPRPSDIAHAGRSIKYWITKRWIQAVDALHTRLKLCGRILTVFFLPREELRKISQKLPILIRI